VDWRRTWRVLQFLLGVLLVALAVRSILANWRSAQAQPVDWRLLPGWIALSAAVVLAGYAILIEGWRRVVLSLGERLTFARATRIWFLASLGKYLPGKVWSLAGAAVLARRAGVDPSVAVAGALVLQALALASGALTVALTARSTFQSIGPGMIPLAIAVLVACAAGLGLLASQPLLDRVSRMLPRSVPPLRAVPVGMLALGFAANLIAWVAYGLALHFLAHGVLADVALSLPQAVGVFTCSYLAGFIALFAPGGLGPRESVFILMLAGDIGIKPAAGLAVASRLLLTATEVLPAVPLLLQRDTSRLPSGHHDG
jgi:hypothetical protein